jgi:hypothetical protein
MPSALRILEAGSVYTEKQSDLTRKSLAASCVCAQQMMIIVELLAGAEVIIRHAAARQKASATYK